MPMPSILWPPGEPPDSTADSPGSTATILMPGLRPLSTPATPRNEALHQLVRIYLLVGEPEKALDQLESLLKMPYFLSPGWLRIDPTFASLKGNPRFERLVAGK